MTEDQFEQAIDALTEGAADPAVRQAARAEIEAALRLADVMAIIAAAKG